MFFCNEVVTLPGICGHVPSTHLFIIMVYCSELKEVGHESKPSKSGEYVAASHPKTDGLVNQMARSIEFQLQVLLYYNT